MLGIFKRHKDKSRHADQSSSFGFAVESTPGSTPYEVFYDSWPTQRELCEPLVAPELDVRRHGEWITLDERVRLIAWMFENDLPPSTFVMRLEKRNDPYQLVVECDFFVLGNDGSPIAVDTPDGFIIDRKRFTVTSQPPFWPKGLPAKAAT